MLTDRYVSDFKSIHKNAKISLDTESMATVKDFWGQMALMKIKEIGQNRTVDLVEELRAGEIFDKSSFYRSLKKQTKD